MKEAKKGDVIAKRGRTLELILDNVAERLGHIHDKTTKEDSEIMSIDAFLKFGYWEAP